MGDASAGYNNLGFTMVTWIKYWVAVVFPIFQSTGGVRLAAALAVASIVVSVVWWIRRMNH